MVSLVDGPADRQALFDHPLPDHMPRDLVLGPGPNLVPIETRVLLPAAGRPGADEQPTFARHGEGPLRRPALVLRRHVRRPVVLPNRLEALDHLLLRIDVPQPNLVRPALPEQ